MPDKISSDRPAARRWRLFRIFAVRSVIPSQLVGFCLRGIHNCTATPSEAFVSQVASATFTYTNLVHLSNHPNKNGLSGSIPTQPTMFYAVFAGVLAFCAWVAFKPRRRKIMAHPRDVIFSIASCDMEEYNNQSLQHFANPLGLEALVSMPTYEEVPRDLEDLDHSFSQSNTVTHQLLLNEKPSDVKLTMKLAWLREDLASPVLVVWQGREWIPLRYWLSYLALAAERDFTGDEGYELQRRWWQANGLTFDFGELPHTARRKIALYLSD